MLKLNEYQMVNEDVEKLDEKLTDSVYEEANTFDIEEDSKTLQTHVRLFNENDECIMECVVEDYQTASVYLEELFDIESEDEE